MKLKNHPLFSPPPQSKSVAPLCLADEGVQRLASLWERTQLKGAHSFLLAVTQHVTPQAKVSDIKWLHFRLHSE